MVGGPQTDSFTVKSSNGTYSSAAGTVSVPITAVADTPSTPVAGTPSVDTTTGVVSGSVSSTDPAGQPLSYALASGPAGDSTVTVNADGTYSYHPSTQAQLLASVGGPQTDSFTVKAS